MLLSEQNPFPLSAFYSKLLDPHVVENTESRVKESKKQEIWLICQNAIGSLIQMESKTAAKLINIRSDILLIIKPLIYK